MAVANVTTITVQNLDGWNQMMDGYQKSKAILEKYGAKNVRLLVPVSGGGPSGTVHSIFEADDLAALGQILNSIYVDPEMIAVMQAAGDSTSWVSSILMELAPS